MFSFDGYNHVYEKLMLVFLSWTFVNATMDCCLLVESGRGQSSLANALRSSITILESYWLQNCLFYNSKIIFLTFSLNKIGHMLLSPDNLKYVNVYKIFFIIL